MICKLLGVSNLPTIFQVHDLNLLLHCSGQLNRVESDKALQANFSFVNDNWSMAIRYEGAIKAQQDADEFDRALFDSAHGLITVLSQYF